MRSRDLHHWARTAGRRIMLINGKEKHIGSATILSDLLRAENHRPERVAVELNGRIVPRADYDRTAVSDSDSLEIVSFVGGG
jgi:sulfur carrier protein